MNPDPIQARDERRRLATSTLGAVVLVIATALPWRIGPVPHVVPGLLVLLGWGIGVAAMSRPTAAAAGRSPGGMLAVSLCAVLAMVALVFQYPVHAGVLAAAGVAAAAAARDDDGHWDRALWGAFIAAGLLNATAAAWQVLLPAGPRWWLSEPVHGQAVGNLGQPNQLALLCVLGALGVVALASRGVHRLAPFLGAALTLGLGIGLSQSRTGLVLAAVVVVAILRVSSYAARERAVVLGLAIGVAVGVGVAVASASTSQSPHLAKGFDGGDFSSSRLAIWRDAATLVAQYPWTGVGWGRFSEAWSLTALPGRPTAPFDHAHNLPLHLAVELGIPAAAAIVAALSWLSWRAWRSLNRAAPPPHRVMRAAQGLGFAVVGLHSLVEYPLWYPMFLLPFVYWLARCVARAPDAVRPRHQAAGTSFVAVLGMLMIWGVLAAAWDYARVVQAFTPFASGLRQPLEQRVASARSSPLFGHLADYAVATGGMGTQPSLQDFDRPLIHLVNVKLLRAYAEALSRAGDRERASHVAERVREFSAVEDAGWAAACRDEARRRTHFACIPPSRPLSYRDFR